MEAGAAWAAAMREETHGSEEADGWGAKLFWAEYISSKQELLFFSLTVFCSI